MHDLSLTLPQYLDFALANVGAERDDNVARLVYVQLAKTYAYLARFGSHEAELARIESVLFEQLAAAEPGSELQKIRYEVFVDSAHTPEALAYVQALLDGSEELDGLVIDQDKRWELIITLNRYLHDDYAARLQAEQQTDGSDQGKTAPLRRLPCVRYRKPRRNGWRRFSTRRALTSSPACAKCWASCFRPNRLALLEPERERILAAIPVMNQEASPEFLDEVPEGLTPATCTQASVDRLAQANTEFAGMLPLVVKAYLVHHQNDSTCVGMKALAQ